MQYDLETGTPAAVAAATASCMHGLYVAAFVNNDDRYRCSGGGGKCELGEGSEWIRIGGQDAHTRRHTRRWSEIASPRPAIRRAARNLTGRN